MGIWVSGVNPLALFEGRLRIKVWRKVGQRPPQNDKNGKTKASQTNEKQEMDPWFTHGSGKEAERAKPSSDFITLAQVLSGEKVKRDDLEIVGVLGYGGFGTVQLCEHKGTLALKSISKGYIIEKDIQDMVLREKEVLMMTQPPFVCRLYNTYNAPDTLQFLLEPCLGGDLDATFYTMNFYGSVEHCTFYSAGVVLAFEHLHSRKIIYRDLKPENIVLMETGQIKLTDFGCCHLRARWLLHLNFWHSELLCA